MFLTTIVLTTFLRTTFCSCNICSYNICFYRVCYCNIYPNNMGSNNIWLNQNLCICSNRRWEINYSSWRIMPQWKRINCKHSARWQHLSQLKASAFLSEIFLLGVKKHNNLYLRLVMPSSGWYSPIANIRLA